MREASVLTRFESPDSVTALRRHVRLRAQREPHLARRHSGVDRLGSRTISHGTEHQIVQERDRASPELVFDSTKELAASHPLTEPFAESVQ